jgi:ferredoxin-NADP reductase
MSTAGRPRRDALNAVVALVLTAVVALWASAGGEAVRPRTAAEWLISAGRLSGLLSAGLLLVAVALMARIPWVERFGHDDLTRRHRLVAMWSFGLLWVHIVLSVLGYARRARTGVPRMLWELFTTFPGMLLALAGTAALTVVTTTSARVARRRLRYESWHLLHLYSYLGAGLAVPHQIWVGGDFVGSPVARFFWVGAWVATAAAVLVFRVAVPLVRTWRHRIRVLDVHVEAPGVVSLTLGGRDLPALGAQAGQYFVWRFRDGRGWSRGHPYSLSAVPAPDRLRITVKSAGPDSARLAGLRRGTRVLFEGPYGAATATRWRGGPLAMFAGGIGITPLLALLQELPWEDGDAVLVYRARSEADLVFRDELLDLEILRGLTVHHLPGPPGHGDMAWLPEGWPAGGGTTAALTDLVPDLASRDVFVCGPDGWADAVCAAVTAAGVPPEHVCRERFAW